MGEKRILFIRLHDRFIELIQAFMLEHDMNQVELAKLVGMPRHVLNYLLNKSSHRKLSAYYLRPFIHMGVINLEDIYDQNPETVKEKKFWQEMERVQKVLRDRELIELIAAIREQTGVDVKNALKQLFPNVSVN